MESDDFCTMRSNALRGKRRKDQLVGWLSWRNLACVIFQNRPALNANQFISLSWLKQQIISYQPDLDVPARVATLEIVLSEWEDKWTFKATRVYNASFSPVFAELVSLHFDFLHLLPVYYHRLISHKRILEDGPNPKQLHRWANNEHNFNRSDDNDEANRTKSKWGGQPLHRVVVWLDASRYVRDQGKIHHARAAMDNLAKIEADQPVLLTRPGTSGEKSKGKWSVDGIRKARVKFDAYSMLLFRAFSYTATLQRCIQFVHRCKPPVAGDGVVRSEF